MLDPARMSQLPDKPYLSGRLRSFLEGISGYEEILDRLRIFTAEQKFLIGVRLLTGAIDVSRAGKAFSDLADPEDRQHPVAAQLHECGRPFSLKSERVYAVVIQQTGCAIDELHGGLGNSVDAVLAQRCYGGLTNQMFKVIVSGASGDYAFALAGQIFRRYDGMGLDRDQRGKIGRGIFFQESLQGIGDDETGMPFRQRALLYRVPDFTIKMRCLGTERLEMDRIVRRVA
jgi:hypothetical protein